MKSIPQIREINGIPTLYVHEKPFIALAGQTHNSAGASAEHMKKHVWNNIRGLNVNTIITPVYWELIEQVEGVYDFSLVDDIIKQAREANNYLIFLWFGLWKNGGSIYIPAWMKGNKKYFLVEKRTGGYINTISPLCEEAVEKDMLAFSALMRHIREVDNLENTVIMMQVENEIGLLGTDLDCSPAAKKAYKDAIPQVLGDEYNVKGTWEEAFGKDAGEYFMAYYFALAVEKIASAGIKEYPLPCFVNVWLKQFPWYPGSYPSGGAVVEVQRIWKVVAPSIFTYAPDIHLAYVADVLDQYAATGNALIVPETRNNAQSASYALYALGHHSAVCYAPFAIEDLRASADAEGGISAEMLKELNIDEAAFKNGDRGKCISEVYKVIDELTSLLIKYRGTGHIKGFARHNEQERGALLSFEDYDAIITYKTSGEEDPISAGVIIELEKNKFIVAALMCHIHFREKPYDDNTAALVSKSEGCFEKGEFKPLRVHNGDERPLHFYDTIKCYEVEEFKYGNN